MSYNSSYLIDVIDPAKGRRTLKAFIAYIKASKVQFDTVICRGVSGLLVAPAVAQSLKKHLIVVRKQDGNHSGALLEGFRDAKRFIIVDDFICSGNTIREQLNAMANGQSGAQCVGIFCYRSSKESNFDYTRPNESHASINCYSMWPRDDGQFKYYPEFPKVIRRKKAIEVASEILSQMALSLAEA